MFLLVFLQNNIGDHCYATIMLHDACIQQEFIVGKRHVLIYENRNESVPPQI